MCILLVFVLPTHRLQVAGSCALGVAAHLGINLPPSIKLGKYELCFSFFSLHSYAAFITMLCVVRSLKKNVFPCTATIDEMRGVGLLLYCVFL